MNRKIDRAGSERFFELLDENALPADRSETGVRTFVAAGADRNNLRCPAGLAEPPRHVVRLPQRKFASARADAKGTAHRNPKIFRIVRRSDSRSCGSSAHSFKRRIG